MVIEILMAQNQAIDPLRSQRVNAVFETVGITVIDEATGHSIRQADPVIYFPQQQCAAVRGDPPAIEAADNIPPTQGVKF